MIPTASGQSQSSNTCLRTAGICFPPGSTWQSGDSETAYYYWPYFNPSSSLSLNFYKAPSGTSSVPLFSDPCDPYGNGSPADVSVPVTTQKINDVTALLSFSVPEGVGNGPYFVTLSGGGQCLSQVASAGLVAI
ncbi:hypothetical protein HDU76_000716, partial [Blyttiomyces sp. JEL0837]